MGRPVAPEVLVALVAAGLTPRAVVRAPVPDARARAVDGRALVAGAPVGVPAGPAVLAVPEALGVLGRVVLVALAVPVGDLAAGSRRVVTVGLPAVVMARGRVDRGAVRVMSGPGTATTTGGGTPGRAVVTRLSGIHSVGSCPVATIGVTAVVALGVTTGPVVLAVRTDATTARARVAAVPAGTTEAATAATTAADATTAVVTGVTTVQVVVIAVVTGVTTVLVAMTVVVTAAMSGPVVVIAAATGAMSVLVAMTGVVTAVTSVPAVVTVVGIGATSGLAVVATGVTSGPAVATVVDTGGTRSLGGMSVVGTSGMTAGAMSGRLGTGFGVARLGGVGRRVESVGLSGGMSAVVTAVGTGVTSGRDGMTVVVGTSGVVGRGATIG